MHALTSDLSLIFLGYREQREAPGLTRRDTAVDRSSESVKLLPTRTRLAALPMNWVKRSGYATMSTDSPLGEDGLQHVPLVLGPVELAESAAGTADVPHGRVALQLDIAFAKREAVATERDAVPTVTLPKSLVRPTNPRKSIIATWSIRALVNVSTVRTTS